MDVLNLDLVAHFTQARRALPDVSADEQAILAHLSADPAYIDEIVAAAGLSAATVGSALVTLELKGMARSVGGMMYVRT